MSGAGAGAGDTARRNLEDFTRRANRHDRKVQEKEAVRLERAIRAAGFGPGSVALDMGIGTGNAALPFLRAGGRVLGVELTPAMAQKGAKQLASFGESALFAIAAAERAPVADSGADAAVCRNVFHHFEEPRAVLAEMVRAVRPGGHVFVIDFYDPEEEAEREVLNRIESLRAPSHVRTLSLGDFRTMFKAAGLRLLEPVTMSLRAGFAQWLAGGDASPEGRAMILGDMEQMRGAGGGWWEVEGEGEEMFFTRKRVILTGVKSNSS